jgi:hypothetical protein
MKREIDNKKESTIPARTFVPSADGEHTFLDGYVTGRRLLLHVWRCERLGT